MEKTKKQNFKIPFIFAIITTLALIGCLFYVIKDRNEIVNEYNELYIEKKEIKALLETNENNTKEIQELINTYKNFYDSIVFAKSNQNEDWFKTFKSGYGSEPRMFVSETVLINPVDEKVSVYLHVNEKYEIEWEYNSNALIVKPENTSSGLVSLDITYNSSKNGVEPITISNSITGEKITIFCIKE